MGEQIEIPLPEDQKQKISLLLAKSVARGEIWYLIDSKWLRSLKQFIGVEVTSEQGVSHPGPIDNSNLIDANGELKNGLLEKVDYDVISGECWDLLYDWYGICNYQEPIKRKVIMLSPNFCVVEVYPIELRCFKGFESKKALKVIVSKEDTLDKVNFDLKKQFNVNQNTRTRLVIAADDGNTTIPSLDITVTDAGLINGSSVILEIIEDEHWPRKTTKQNVPVGKTSSSLISLGGMTTPSTSLVSSFAGGGRVSRTSLGTNASPRQPGICGLTNLGNTCFMNSVLQCMSNCPPITEYFLTGQHLNELNETNPLGMKGEIAKVYGDLIQTIWSGQYPSTNPLQFKIQVGKFNPSFNGCQQHDSQELLTFLLDGLHEDLNRIKKKPYIEVKDQASRPDNEVAKEAWENYKKRNDSVIVDTFHGLLKSRVVCPECERVSVTFDPFCYLSLPLPLKKDRIITVRYIPFESKKRENSFRISVPRKGVVRDLCQELSEKISCKPDKLLVSEIIHSHFHKFYSNDDSLDSIDEKDVIYAYQLPNSDYEDLIVPVCFWEKVKPIDRFAQNHLFGIPFLITIPRRSMNVTELHNSLKEKMERHFEFRRNDSLNGENFSGNDEAGTSIESFFPLFTLDTSKATLNPQPVQIIDNHCNISAVMESNYINRSLGRIILIVQMTAEQRRDLYREKPAEYGTDVTVSSQTSSGREKNGKVDIQDCISLFTTCEKLSADDAWYCPACRKHQRATKKFDIWKLPKILIIHLKRFSYTRSRRDKLDILVEFPLTKFDINDYVINTEAPNIKYDVIGVCNHYGHMGGGHYTAFCKNKNTKEWYCFDDNSVSPLQAEDNIMTSAAYVLFYMARDDSYTGDECMDIN